MRKYNSLYLLPLTVLALGVTACGANAPSLPQPDEPDQPSVSADERPRPGETKTAASNFETHSIPDIMKDYGVKAFDEETGIDVAYAAEDTPIASQVSYKKGRATFEFVSASKQSANTQIVSCTKPTLESDIDPNLVGKWTLTVTDPGVTIDYKNGGHLVYPPVSDYPKVGQEVCAGDHTVTRNDHIETRTDIIFTN